MAEGAEASGRDRVVGRYVVHDAIAAGGMATIHVGRLRSVGGFSRTVAIKRLHAQFASDPEFVAQFLDEARLAASVHHPNVVPVLDVIAREGELFLVMEYVKGESLARLFRAAADQGMPAPVSIVSAVGIGMLEGLHAIHEARGARGEPLHGVHRDVSPQNVIVGVDGLVRVVDLGIAKAANRMHSTHNGELKGKLAYMAPEQLNGGRVDRRTDIWAASVVLWELLSGRRLFSAETPVQALAKILAEPPVAPSTYRGDLREAVDEVVRAGLQAEPGRRFATAQTMAAALEKAIPPATAREVGAWVERLAAPVLLQRAQILRRVEESTPDEVGPETFGPASIVAAPSAYGGPSIVAAPEATLPGRGRVGADAAPMPATREPAPPGPTPAPARAHRRASIAFAALAGSLVVVAVVVLLRRGDSGSHAAPQPSAGLAAEPQVTGPLPPASAETAIPETTPATTPTPAASRASEARPRRSPPPPKNKPPSCADPFTYDAQGVKIPKRECL